MIWLRSIAAVSVGLLAVFVLSRGTDQLLPQMQFYPAWGQSMHDPIQDAVMLFYRCVYAVLGGYIAAKFAPFKPINHVLVLGIIGFAVALTAYFVKWTSATGPAWYPLALVVTAIPCSWLGGYLQQRMLVAH